MRRGALRRAARLLVFGLMLACSSAGAHELRPGFLSLTEIKAPLEVVVEEKAVPDQTTAVWFSVLMKIPMRGDLRMPLQPIFASDCQSLLAKFPLEDGVASTRRWTLRCDHALAGRVIAVEGLATAQTDLLVSIEYLNGDSETARLSASQPQFQVAGTQDRLSVAASYGRLGIEHILLGIDHLLFVLLLLMLSRGTGALVKTISAFTLAHSITLAAAALGVLHVPAAPVEAVIALSIVFLATELARKQRGQGGSAGIHSSFTPNLTDRFPWLIAFIFGLLHGLGFAGALSEIGLPDYSIALALLSFNLGVELGQLLFIVALFGLYQLVRKPQGRLAGVPVKLGISYAVGGVAMFWLLDRLTALVSLKAFQLVAI
ncbi:MAG: HupE/UreJ family protein [Motiliproteus sp.]